MLGLGGVAGSVECALPAAASPYGFNQPTAIVQNSGHLWIVNVGGNSVTETTSTGAWMRTVSGTSYGFSTPVAIASFSWYLFVVNHGGSVTEINAANGAFVRLVKGAAYEFGSPSAIAVSGSTVWVVDSGSNAVTEFSATTGSLIRVLTNASAHYGFATPNSVAVAGSDLWVVNRSGGSTTDPDAGSLTEIAASTGALVRVVTAANDGLQRPFGIAFDGMHLWISDTSTDSVTEMNPVTTNARVVSNSSLNQNYGFAGPTAVAASGGYVYVISPATASPMVTQINSATGDGDWYECNSNTPDPNFNNPTALVVYNGDVWVVSPGDNTLTELSLADGGNRIGLFT